MRQSDLLVKDLPAALIARWPGKSAYERDGLCHPAVWHMLDVAAVAEVFLENLPFSQAERQAITLLTALHDLGKIGAQFQAAVLDGRVQQGGKHWEVSEVWLRENADLFCGFGLERPRWLDWVFAASAGHHGRPPDKADFLVMKRNAGLNAPKDARQVIQAFMALWPEAALPAYRREQVLAFSWWLPGFIAVCDWIGSNPDWFPAHSPEIPLYDYLEAARARAKTAVKQAGFIWPRPSAQPLLDQSLRPMQQASQEIPLRDGPMLAVIEDETGSGKTEAALLLAQRMMLAGKASGLYFALPTMATANAMFTRMSKAAGRLFATPPSLTLAHGRAEISKAYRDIRSAPAESPQDVSCAPWLAERRIRALLADVGVGTIDQALLAVLPTKHNCLRLFGLSRKVLIVDETHELGDPYMLPILEQLLRMQAAHGGSAILLTATLPLPLRQRLISAFEDGAGRVAPPGTGPAYPALTVAGGASVQNFAPGPQVGKGPVQITRLSSQEAVVQKLRQAAASGAAAVWIRNSVDEAIAARDLLAAEGIQTDLLHARFALGDRLAHEDQAIGRFGRDSQDRAGRILIATQILEASIDIDFDVMISDLAPVAALVQRMGRLWRHMDLRPLRGRPVPLPEFCVLSPDPEAVSSPDWLRPLLGKGAGIYAPEDLWRTAMLLSQRSHIESPRDLRALIEAVHGDDLADLPAILDTPQLARTGEALSAGAAGRRNALKPEDDYRKGGGNWEDTEFPTRLGQEQRPLMLVREENGGLSLWHRSESRADAEMLSSLQAAVSRLNGLDLPDQTRADIFAVKQDWPDWKQGTLVLPVAADGQICPGLRYQRHSGLLFE
ncbi:CRISPR-associated helicase Cas3' [Pseudogemmobacter faecipullorum]|uniref:CRISPR-associated helicase Cas3 n=1 Tax=Pseudogemmobacter faecipullorum TaxID=2755041 RepID=A0ABS8CS65_9RHOB|nr:CRISPR-associated helicase Cas3' [Pseudogemmobacter faecipullorum]MCB5412199.1 CRISPR-associated helicase Cas3' [Pseudogemmobacter faecipullorum]